jgi:predicted small integral membrane protein
MKPLAWMAWTWQTGAFFAFIALCLITMFVWELLKPGGSPRTGILKLDTTRGDRLFISLLGSAYIHVAWLGLTSMPLWWGSVVAVIYALAVFRWV